MNVRWINELGIYRKERVFVMLKLKRLAAMCCAAMLTLGASALAETQVNVTALKGPTAMGMVKLMDEAESGAVEGNAYSFAIAAAVDEVTPKIVKGETDIAAVPANLASVLYQNTKGEVQVLAVNTLGVIYIVESGDSVKSVEDLRGRTSYASGKGATPEYALNYILSENGIDPAKDVTIEWKTSEEVTALMASGGIDLCMLPVPAATSVMMQNADVRDAIDLNDVWQEVGAAGTFTMGCVVARSDFVEEHPEAVDAFLTEYAASIAYVNEHPEEAAALVEQYGIVPKAAVAKAAIPQANMVCLTGDELKGISDYYEVLYAADPTSIGGAIPDDNFYYIP